MSQYVPGVIKSFKALADLSAKQFYAVKIVTSDNGVNIATSATADPIGTLINEPKSGEGAAVALSGTSKGIAGGSIGLGDFVTADSNGALVATTSANDHVLGKAIEVADSGDVFEFIVGLSNL